jgi:hypothetical protein
MMMNLMILMKALIKLMLIQLLELLVHKIIEGMMNTKVLYIKEIKNLKV